MGYMHIDNLYRCQDILAFRECYVLEKIHGTSAHIRWKDGRVTFSPGGEAHERFRALFNEAALAEKFAAIGADVVVYGEAYGGKQQGMKDTYGSELKFIVFDVQIGGVWLSVPQMDEVARSLGLEVVEWAKVSTDLAVLDAWRDKPSTQAVRNGCGDKPREGVVLRPPIEVTKNNGDRIIAKHKGAAFEERKTPQKVVDPATLEVLAKADAIADEWVTPMRLTHVLDKIPEPHGMEHTPAVIKAMVADVYREAKGEIVESKEAERAIGKKAAALFKQRVQQVRTKAAEGAGEAQAS